MKAPACEICGDFGNGSYVQFADYQPISVPGHPPGLEYFCSVHLRDAQQLANLPAYDAVNRIRAAQRQNPYAQPPPPPHHNQNLHNYQQPFNQNPYANPQPYNQNSNLNPQPPFNQNSVNAGAGGGLFKAFSYVFQDPDWIKKVLIGSVVTAFPVVEAISDGYQIETIKNIRAGNPRPLPEWDDVTSFFMKGIGLRIAIYAIYIPTLITSVLAIMLTIAGLASWLISDSDTIWWIRAARGLGWVIIPLIDVIVLAIVPIVLLIVPAMARRMADGESFIALFNPFPTLKLILTNFGTYVLSRVSVAAMLILAGFASVIFNLFPVIGLVLGWAVLSVARFWGRLMWAYYLAHMKRGKE